jgi:hypothetical protein
MTNLTMPISFLKKHSYYITAILLISFAPYFIFYNHNFEQITFNQTIQPLMFLSLLVLFMFVILYFLFNIFPKYYKLIFASSIVLLIFIINFDYIYYDLMRKVPLMESYFDPKLIFLFVYLLGVYTFLNLLKINFIKNFFLFYCIFLLVTPALGLCLKYLNNNEDNIQNEPKAEDRLLERQDISNNESILKENVYFILLDGYASEKTFSRKSFNNNSFYKYLKNSNFKILGDQAAYNMSYLSLTSIFNLSYPVVEGYFYNNRINFYPFLLKKDDAPPLIEKLENLQYEFIFYGNTWSGCKKLYVKCGNPSGNFITYESFIFFQKTALKFLINESHDYQYDAISNFLQEDSKVKMQDAKFHFFHHFSPHPPYLENDCKTLKPVNLKDEGPFEDYLVSVKCVNSLVIEFIAYIDKNDPSAIIIIQSDHGPETNPNIWLESTDLIENVDVDNRVSILNSIRSPKKCDKWLKNNLGPINTTRFVLGCLEQEEPIYIEEKTFIGFQEEHEDFGTVKEFNSILR